MRGIPWLAPVMTTLGEISDYQDAQILKQKIGSLLAFFVKLPLMVPPTKARSSAIWSPAPLSAWKKGRR